MNQETLSRYGIDWKKGIARCMNDRGLFEGTLGLFLEDDCLDRGRAALEEKNYRALFACMHELKGACGNVEMTELYAAVCPLVDLLRGNEPKDEPAVRDAFIRVESAYLRAREGIVLALEQA